MRNIGLCFFLSRVLRSKPQGVLSNVFVSLEALKQLNHLRPHFVFWCIITRQLSCVIDGAGIATSLQMFNE